MSIKDSTIFKVPVIIIIAIILMVVVLIVLLQLREQYNDNDPMLRKIKDYLSDVDPGIKNTKMYVGNRSYTINKEKVFLCLKDEKGKYYDLNQLVYVFLHEYAHTLCNEIGHTDHFYKIFDELLKKAQKLGKYDPNIPLIQNYCTY